MKQTLKQFLAFAMATLVLWAGNGYGVLEHLCEEHGKHQHILSNWVKTSCEHEHHYEPESHQQPHTASGFQTPDSDGQVSFVHFYAETLSKTSVVSATFIPLFQVTLSLSFLFPTNSFSSKILVSFPSTSVFRRTFGRSLLVWVQSFLI